jgi:hypothetical protein
MKKQRKNQRKYFVSYVLQSDCKSITPITIIAMPLFGEKGRFTLEESQEVVKLIERTEVPDFSKSLEGWFEFTAMLNRQIFELYGK